MTALLQIGLVNAVVATLLACVVALIARRVRRPALIHALWIIVLVKLITPPLFEIPIEVPFQLPGFTASVVEQIQTSAGDPGNPSVPFSDSNSAAARESATIGGPAGSQYVGAVPAVATAATQTLSSRAGEIVLNVIRWLARHPASMLAGIWMIGGLVWYMLQAFTAYKFSQRLALATPAPAEIQREADELAAAMGLVNRPPVLIVRDVISPMLWGIGRNTRLLFPLNLLNRIDNGARATLIAHELAHYRRGDHWVRAFELVVSGLFWWHPVVWWARRQIEIAEEECCDAWVIEQFPDTPRWYAEALLETLDFLAEAALVLPPAAAGAGHVPFLRQRLIAIMRGVAPQKMTGRTWCAVVVMALATLPWHPGFITASSHAAAATASPEANVENDSDATTDLVAAQMRLDEIAQAQQAELLRVALEMSSAVQSDQPWARANSPCGRYSVTRRGSQGVYLYNAIANQQIDMSESRILTVAFSSDGDRFATGEADQTVRLWSSSTGALIKTFRGHAGPVHSVAFMPQDRELISAGNDGRLMRWSIADMNEQSPAASPHTPANCLAISPDGRWLAIGTGSWMKEEGGQIVIWELASMEFFEFSCSDPVGVLMFRPDSQTLAAGDFHGRVTFWDIPSRKRLGTTLPRYKNAIAAAQFSRNSEDLAMVTTDDISRDPSWQLPRYFPWFSDRSTELPKPAAPLASSRANSSEAATNSIEPTDADRLRHIREEIDALERDLAPAEPTPGFDGSNDAFTQ